MSKSKFKKQMKLTIKTLGRKEIQTQYGPKEKLTLTFTEKPGTLIDSFVGNWNSAWKIGDVIEIEKDQFVSREYNGKTYWNLKAPAGAGGFNLKPLTDALQDLTARVEALEAAVYEPEQDKSAFDDINDIPVIEPKQEANQPNDDSIPF
jgi:hypothetical protein